MSYETKAGNLGRGELRMVASSICRFDNGAVGNLTMNYLNPSNFGSHGNDQLRLYGTKGMIEAVDNNSRMRIATGDGPLRDVEPAPPQPSYFDLFVEHVLDGKEMPLPLERELQSTLTVIAMNEAAKTGRAVSVPVLK
jgi:predicted dehydrogenase